MKRTLFTTPQDAESAFYEAIERADLDAMMGVWADDEDIICIHPGGERLTGMPHVRESWRQIFSRGQTLQFRLHHQQMLNGMTLAVHSVYEQISVAGQSRGASPVIATNIYMRTGNGWRMVVHHASPAPVRAEPSNASSPKTLH